MGFLIKTAWRNLFRQRRRTFITVAAMALSLAIAIPINGLVHGMNRMLMDSITLKLGHAQIHDPSYATGKALQNTLPRADRLVAIARKTPGVLLAAARAHGAALASHDARLKARLVALPPGAKALFGRGVSAKARWRKDRAFACEALVYRSEARPYGITIGTVFTPAPTPKSGRCERVQIVGLLGGKAKTAATKRLRFLLPSADLKAAFGSAAGGPQTVVVRHATTATIVGVDPPVEKKLSGLAKKVRKGRYLGARPRGEIVIGYRIAKSLHLQVGDKVFLQAGSLDQTSGNSARDFKVVGIFRTGDDRQDRSELYIHLADARKLMSLGGGAHEIAIRMRDRERLDEITWKLSRRTRQHGFRVDKPQGSRAGSTGLAAPMVVTDRRAAASDSDDGLRLLPAYDVKLRLEGVEGVGRVAARVYTATELRPARAIRLKLAVLPADELTKGLAAWPAAQRPKALKKCEVYVRAAPAKRLGLKVGARLVVGGESAEACTHIRVAAVLPELAGTGAPTAPSNKAGAKAPPSKSAPTPKARTSGAKAPKPRAVPPARSGAKKPPAKASPPRPAPRRAVANKVSASKTQPAGAPGEATVTSLPAAALYAVEPPDSDDDDDLGETLSSGPLRLFLPGPPQRLRVVGVEAAAENAVSRLSSQVRHGKYLPASQAVAQTSWPVLLSATASRRLGLAAGQSGLIAVKSADGKKRWHSIRVRGVLRADGWSATRPQVILPFYQAQQIDAKHLNAKAHEVAVGIARGAKAGAVEDLVRARLRPLVRTWREVSPTLSRMIDMQEAWMALIMLIIFAIAAGTVMNTMLMAVFERTKEFGVLKSIGMRPSQVFGLVVIETVFLALLSAVLGGGIGLYLDYLAHWHGIDLSRFTSGMDFEGVFLPPVWRSDITVSNVLTPILMVTAVCFFVSLYPAWRAGRLQPVKALRHH